MTRICVQISTSVMQGRFEQEDLLKDNGLQGYRLGQLLFLHSLAHELQLQVCILFLGNNEITVYSLFPKVASCPSPLHSSPFSKLM